MTIQREERPPRRKPPTIKWDNPTTSFIVGFAIACFGFWSMITNDESVIIAGPCLVVAVAVVLRSATLFSFVLALNFPYAVGAYFGVLNGIQFYPWAPPDDYKLAAVRQVSLLLAAVGIGIATGVAARFHGAFKAGCESIRVTKHKRRNVVYLAAVSAFIVGAHDALFIGINFSVLTGSGRHVFRDDFWVAHGPLGIVLSISLSIFLIVTAIGDKRNRLLMLSALMVFWAPTLVAGSRNYLSVLGVSAILVTFFLIRSIRFRLIIAAVSIVAVAAFFWLPTQWSSNELIGMNEWILPTSSYMPLMLGTFTVAGIGATPLVEQWPLLLPSWLRPYEIRSYPEEFANLKVTNVGVAGNPWAETFADSQLIMALLFISATLSLFVFAVLLRRVTPLAPILCGGLMAFWGRSSYWNTLFILVYGSLALWLLLQSSRKSSQAKNKAFE